MTKAQQHKVDIFKLMGYELFCEHPDGSVWVARPMSRGKTVYQEINAEGVAIRTFSRPNIEDKNK